jgi:hypothetical protein
MLIQHYAANIRVVNGISPKSAGRLGGRASEKELTPLA